MEDTPLIPQEDLPVAATKLFRNVTRQVLNVSISGEVQRIAPNDTIRVLLKDAKELEAFPNEFHLAE